MLPDLLWIIMTFGYDNWVFNSKKVFLEIISVSREQLKTFKKYMIVPKTSYREY